MMTAPFATYARFFMKSMILPTFNFKAYPLLWLLLISLLGSTPVGAKISLPDLKPKSTAFEITKSSILAKIEATKSRQGLDEAIKSKVLSIYQSAQDNLANSENFTALAIDFNAGLKLAPEKSKKLQHEIEQTLLKLSKQSPQDYIGLPTEELDQLLVTHKGTLSSVEEQLTKLDNDLVLQQARPQHIREETVTAKQDIENVQKKLETPADASTTKLETEANSIYLKTLFDSRTAELKMLDVEAISNPARVDTLKTELHLLEIQKNALIPIIAAIENTLTDRRQQEAKLMQDANSEAEKALSGKHPHIQTLTHENSQYSRDLQAITDKIETYTLQKTKIDALAAEIDNDFKSAEKKIRLAGLSPALGRILREQRRNLISQDSYSMQSEVIQNETAFTSLEQFKIEDKLKQLSDIDAYLQEIMAQKIDPKLPVAEQMRIQTELRVLLNSQKDLLNKRAIAYTTYLRTLGDFDFARQQMQLEAVKFANYLDENLLWVKSSDPVNANTIAGLFYSTKWLLSPLNWMAFTKDLLRGSLQHTFLYFLGGLGFVLLLLAKRQAKRQLALIAVKVDKIYTDNFNYTLQALAYTWVMVIPLPLLSYYLGWLLLGDRYVVDFTRAIALGLQHAATPMFFLQFYYRLFAEGGIARQHFQWQKNTAALLRKQLAWLRFVAVLTIAIIHCTAGSKVSLHSDNLGRLALIASMLAMAVFTGRLLNPKTGLLQGFIKNDPNGWLSKLRYFWYPAITSIPLVIIGFAVTGYYLSALELQQQLIESLRLLFLLVILYEMVIRWLNLVNRQLAIKNAQQKRKVATQAEKQPVAGGEDPVLPVEGPIDIPKINAQTMRLLNLFTILGLLLGLWIIWKNIVPAFSFLENIVLWQHRVTIDNQDSLQPITLTNLMLAGLYFFIVGVSVRNFSGIMELLVFRRLSIETGSRYAINQLANYSLMAIGFIAIANELGGSWSQVQWLVAALSVGLGFGLQEIFANLVSGIILLFERPIRVGDTVTIGSVTGKVSRIQMRATTLIDWDQKEHVVPNKTFITSQLVNWTLTDTITRVEINVGIAYEADVALAHKVLLDTVLSTPLILTEPAPSVFVVGFGDNAVNFSIRIFVSELANRLPVSHDLLVRLQSALRAHNIEIPYPQRDIHIRSVSQEVMPIPQVLSETIVAKYDPTAHS
ncbi:MAG: mechanosensitive ion channel [Methylococcales bacterium]|nr:mechanosensitive ion channel [Methylococcales bacterium]